MDACADAFAMSHVRLFNFYQFLCFGLGRDFRSAIGRRFCPLGASHCPRYPRLLPQALQVA